MTTSIISTVNNPQVGKNLINELVKAGLAQQDIEVLEGSAETILSEIIDRGFDEAAAQGYIDSLEGERVLVAARPTDKLIDSTMAIMERYEIAGEQADDVGDEDDAGDADETLLEVEEELAVNKSKVAQGGVRVTHKVSEKPVEETVTLRTETVEVDRQPVTRKLGAKEAGAAFEDKTLEMIGTTEEVEITKEAQVVGEVSLSKKVSEKDKKVQDTVRSSHVEVEKIGVEKSGAKARKPQ